MSGNHQPFTMNLPFAGCDNCQSATVSQEIVPFLSTGLVMSNLIPTCPFRNQRFWDDTFKRMRCESWSLRLRVQNDEEEEVS